MRTIAVLAVAGSLGTLARYGLQKFVQSHAGFLTSNLHAHAMDFPLGTLVVNVVGCFACGLLSRWIPVEWRLAVLTGFLGAFTTFATFSMETVTLWQGGDWWKAGLYFLLSTAGGLAAIRLGLRL